MSCFDFDEVIDRHGTGCNKYDGGRNKPPLPPEKLAFTIADMDFAVAPCIQKALAERIAHPVYGYSHPASDFTDIFTSWMEKRHCASLEKSWIMPCSGVLTGLSFVIRAVTKPGDRIMVFTPVYNHFFDIIEGNGCELVECPLKKEDDRYTMDLDAAVECMRTGIRAVLICNPHNPVGRVWSREELDSLAGLCAKYNVLLLSDEAHADITFHGVRFTTAAALEQMGSNVVACISPNKSFNTAGISIAFLIVKDPEIRSRVSALNKAAWITSPPLLSTVAARAAYSGGGEWLDAVNAYMEANISYIRSFTEQNMPLISIAKMEGTYLLWMDISCLGMDSDRAVKILDEEYDVVLSNGKAYRGDGDKHLRFNAACSRRLIEQAMERMRAMYQKYIK